MQSPCLRHTYLFSHLFAIPPTCFPLIVVPSLPPPCPCRIHTLRQVGVVGLHQGVCPIPPPPPGGDALSSAVPELWFSSSGGVCVCVRVCREPLYL